jgi:hypothetical protein
MVQPKFSPEEALKIIKLRMNYDSSKTLNENIVVLKEQDMATDAKTINVQLDALYTDEQKIVDILKTYDTQEKFEQMLIKYKEVNGKRLGPELGRAFTLPEDKKEIDDLQNFLATIGYGSQIDKFRFADFLKVDDKTAVVDPNSGSFEPLKVQLAINNAYCKNLKDGVIQYGYHKGTTWDSWVKIYKVTPEQIEKAKESCKKKTVDSGGGSTQKQKYTPCEAGKYVRGCKSDVVKKVQACLEMPAKYNTGNFGPITQGELQKKFPDLAKGFTDKDVDVICKKTTKTVTTPDEEGVYDQDNA